MSDERMPPSVPRPSVPRPTPRASTPPPRPAAPSAVEPAPPIALPTEVATVRGSVTTAVASHAPVVPELARMLRTSAPQRAPSPRVSHAAQPRLTSAPRTRDPGIADWERLWLALEARPWRSLAIVSTTARLEALQVGIVLAELGAEYLDAPVHLVDAREMTLGWIAAHLDDARVRVEEGQRVIFALAPFDRNPSGIELVRGLDAALLCVRLGVTRREVVASAVRVAGRERFVGIVSIEEEAPG